MKNKTFICYEAGSIFDKYRIYGTVEKEDEFGNLSIKIYKQFYKTLVRVPKSQKWWWLPFYCEKYGLWYDGRNDPKEWMNKKGDIIVMQKATHDWRLHLLIEESSKEDADELTEEIDELEKLKGVTEGITNRMPIRRTA